VSYSRFPIVTNMQLRQEPIAAASTKQRTARNPRIEVALSGASAYDAADAAALRALQLSASLDAPASRMKPQRFDAQFAAIVDLAAKLCAKTDAGSLLVMLEGPTDWEQLHDRAGDLQVVVAADTAEELAGAEEAKLATI